MDEQYWPFWQWCIENGILLTGRKYIHDQDAMTPAELAGAIIDLVRRGCPVKVWSGLNETQHGGPEQLAKFDLEMIRRLHAEGIQYIAQDAYEVDMDVVDGVPVGHHYDLPIVQEVLTRADYVEYHSYCHHPADAFLDLPHEQMINGQSVWVDGPWGEATWWIGRRRIAIYLMEQRGITKPYPWHINSETGLETYGLFDPNNPDTWDKGYPPWGGDKHGGWRSYTNVEDYARQMIRIDREIWQSIPQLAGCTLFTYGTNNSARWDSYDYGGNRFFLTLIGEWIIASREEEEPQMLPDWIVDLRSEAVEHTGYDLVGPKGLLIHHTGSTAPIVNQLAYLKRHACYHFAVGERIYYLRDMSERVWHAGDGPEGPWNSGGVAASYLGCFMGFSPPSELFLNMAKLHHWLTSQQGMPDVIRGHKDIMLTDCPGDWYPGDDDPNYRDILLGNIPSAAELVARIQDLEGGLVAIQDIVRKLLP